MKTEKEHQEEFIKFIADLRKSMTNEALIEYLIEELGVAKSYNRKYTEILRKETGQPW